MTRRGAIASAQQITPGNISGAVFAGAANSWSHTVEANCKVLLVTVHIQQGTEQTTGTITYNGVNMTRISSQISGAYGVEIWALANPTVGTHTVSYPANSAVQTTTHSISVLNSVASYVNAGAATNAGSGTTEALFAPTAKSGATITAATSSDTSVTASGTKANIVHSTGTSGTVPATSVDYTSGTGAPTTTTYTDPNSGKTIVIAAISIPTITSYDDTFVRANNPIQTNAPVAWQIKGGAPVVASNLMAGGGGAENDAYIEIGSKAQTVTVTIGVIPSGYCGVMLNGESQSITSYCFLAFSTTSYGLFRNGTNTGVTFSAHTLAVNDVMKITHDGAGHVKCYINGTQVATYTDTSPLTVTQCGLVINGSANTVRFSAFHADPTGL